MRPLHVCFLSQEFPPETGWGGIGAYTYEMAHGLAAAGQRVTVIAFASEKESVCCEQGVEIHRVRCRPEWDRWRGLWRLNRIWPGFAWAASRRLREIHMDCPVDIVEAAECRADSLFIPFMRPRPRVIVRLHTAWIFVDRHCAIIPDRKKRFIYRLEASAIRCADMLTAPSQAVVELTDSWIPLGGRVAVVPNPVNTATYSPSGKARTAEVLVVGRLEPRKGVAILAEALPAVLRSSPRSSFRFVGSDGVDATGRSWRERLLDDVPKSECHRVCFEQTSREELIGRYHRAGLCVLPSLWENFPYALLEAMACGVPVVATRTGGFPELIEDGVSGVMVPPSDPGALAEAICTLLEDVGLRERMGRAARRRVEERFSLERIVPEMLEIYRSVRNGGVR